MNIDKIMQDLATIMPGVELSTHVQDNGVVIVNTNLSSNDVNDDGTQFMTNDDESIKLDAFAVSDAIEAMVPGAEVCDDQFCQIYISIDPDQNLA